jgi:hypothetical protein
MSRVIHPALPKPRELLPASLLPYRQSWQPLLHTLPTNSYLIVTNGNHQPQNATLLRLVQQLRRRGEVVYVLSLSDKDRQGALRLNRSEQRRKRRWFDT